MHQPHEFRTEAPGEWPNEPVQEIDPTDPRDGDAPGCVGNLNRWSEEVRPR
jgi:hypothetical protein